MKESKLGRFGVRAFTCVMFPFSGKEGSIRHYASECATAGVAIVSTVPLALKLGENCDQIATLCGAMMLPVTAAAMSATLAHDLYPVVAQKIRRKTFLALLS
jgi:hypothetical protein